MAPLSRGLLVLALALAAQAAAPAPEVLTPAAAHPLHWPSELPVEAMNASWARFAGSYTVDARVVSYQLYVDPERGALYRITRYTVSPPAGATGDEARPMETVLYNALPGRQRLSCYQRRGGPGPEQPWVAVASGTAAYKDEMRRAIEVYGRHRGTFP